MTDEQRELLLQAQDSLEAAKWLMKGEYPGYAAAEPTTQCSIFPRLF